MKTLLVEQSSLKILLPRLLSRENPGESPRVEIFIKLIDDASSINFCDIGRSICGFGGDITEALPVNRCDIGRSNVGWGGERFWDSLMVRDFKGNSIFFILPPSSVSSEAGISNSDLLGKSTSSSFSGFSRRREGRTMFSVASFGSDLGIVDYY